ncbi:MAG: hypothetical protein WCQ00_02125 [bacterium]
MNAVIIDSTMLSLTVIAAILSIFLVQLIFKKNIQDDVQDNSILTLMKVKANSKKLNELSRNKSLGNKDLYCEAKIILRDALNEGLLFTGKQCRFGIGRDKFCTSNGDNNLYKILAKEYTKQAGYYNQEDLKVSGWVTLVVQTYLRLIDKKIGSKNLATSSLESEYKSGLEDIVESLKVLEELCPYSLTSTLRNA